MGSTQSQTEKYTKNLQSLLDLQNIILDLNEDNIDQSVETSFAYLITSDYSYSFILILCKIVYLCFVIQGNDKVCFEYLIKIDIKNVEKGNNIRIIEVFTQFILSISSQESFYLLHKMIENGLIQPKICQYKNIPYFAHYLSSKELCYCRDCPRYKFFFEEIDKLSNNDWELQKQLINDGVNPSEIAQIIRNDEIEKLQEISSQTNFDFNQFIKPSLYERHSFLSQDPNELFPNNVSLVDYAAFFGSIKCFRYLLLNEANLKNSCRFAIAGGNNEILHLCEQNHIPFIRAYEAAIEYHRNDIFHYIYENKLEDNQNLILLGRHCIKFNNYDILLFLFNEGMEINEALIIESIANGNLFLTQYFLKKNPIIIDFLKIKSISGNNELLEFLINNKYIDLNQKIENKEKEFINAAEYGYDAIFKLFLQIGIDINAKDEYYGATALMYAARGKIEMIKLLLEQKNIDVNAKDKWGHTALMKASEFGQTEVIKLLLKHKKININDQDIRGNTALMTAVVKCQAKAVKLLLKQKGIKINIKDLNGRSVITNASELGYIEILKLLLKHKGVKINDKDLTGQTALMCASMSGQYEAVKVLLQQKDIDVNAKSKYGHTALILASKNDHTSIIKLHLNHKGIDINIKNSIGDSALSLAIRNGNEEIIKLLKQNN